MDLGAQAGYVRDMRSLFDAGTASGLSDRQLLERFAAGRDSSAEAAFEAARAAARADGDARLSRALGQEQADVHDAFQATFLVLVRRWKSIRRLESLGSWLFGVASRVAGRARVEIRSPPRGRAAGRSANRRNRG